MIKKIVLPSFILALTSFVSSLSRLPLAAQDNSYISWFLLAVSFTIIFLALKRYKQVCSNGIINFKQAFGYGFKITLCYSGLFAIAYFTYFKLNEVECLKNIETMFEIAKQNSIEASGTSSAKQEKTMNMIYTFISNPYILTSSAFLNNLFYGVVYSLISAAIIRTKEENNAD
jgi:tetrahydromethanopterin S-methyltransferase subunit B